MRGWHAVSTLSLLAAAPAITSFPDATAIDPLDLARRTASAQDAALIARGEMLAPSLSVDPARERFRVVIPAHMPAGGYGLFVYVPPIDQPGLPSEWNSVVERAGMIAISAANSGNGQGAFTRRMPLALIATQGIMQRYTINRDRIVISGFSGGSRVALRLALAYPELFRGALLDAGSDALGTVELHRPVEAELAIARTNRFAFVSGANDSTKFDNGRAVDALCKAGATQTFVREVENLGHDPVPARDLRYALEFLALTTPPPAEAGR